MFLIDLKVLCIFLFSAFDFLHLLEKGILANKDDFSFGLFRIDENGFRTVIGLIYCYFCTNFNFIYSIILIACICKVYVSYPNLL